MPSLIINWEIIYNALTIVGNVICTESTRTSQDTLMHEFLNYDVVTNILKMSCLIMKYPETNSLHLHLFLPPKKSIQSVSVYCVFKFKFVQGKSGKGIVIF